MPVSLNSQVGSSEHMSSQLYNTIFSMLRVSLPGIVQSFDPATCTCTIQPAIAGQGADEKGQIQSAPLPLLMDVPVIFPRGGGCTITFPVKAGDECLVVFSDRCIDFWWQNGGVQEPVDPRQHDLSDAFAFVGPQSQAQKISGISTTSVQVRTDDGSSFIELMQGGNVNITTPMLTVNGNVRVNGSVISTGDQVAKGISQTGHVHSGVQSGGSKTGGPQ
ncbi:translation initiation factor IF-2 [Pantoea ananatis]|uniref:Gp138 family membrane-puncturing spike protein n=1 Tax=Pantoea ananas TaxID=553 RepID=UPI000736FAD3|nr:Gp138 family membrane-puncturing spike protein [Pantoea ananatis]KTR49354.1 translation initiation factor IF-2 [Pantoea ananatis]KTR50984.1 translation initiation factor IF-2 [Pantoea ananatis]KTR65497.1 translation initiation factor IF-2 [Pantoea ananatis]KTR69728.1 translation initiation factor IF-2 [Pantoea ananatis]